MASWSPAPSNRASGPVQAGKLSWQAEPAQVALTVPIRLRRQTLHLPLPPPQPQLVQHLLHRGTALADEPLLPTLHKLSPCRFSTMFAPDELAARVPRIIGDAEVLPGRARLACLSLSKG